MNFLFERLRNPWIRLLFVWTILYALLAFWGLGQMQFWNDEGLMAIGGKRVLQFGYPKAWDGQNLFSFEAGYDLNENLTQIRMPWLGFYISALGMKIFGETIFGARFGFTLLGVLNLPLSFLVIRRFGFPRSTSFFAVVILSTLAAYWLYIRQCYHYSADVTFSLLAILFFLEIKKKWAPLGLALCLIALFNLNYMTPLWLTTLFVIWAIWERQFSILIKRPVMWIAVIFTLAANYAWIRWANVMAFHDTLGGWSLFIPNFSRLGFVLSELDMSFPILMTLPVLFWCGIQSKKDASLSLLFKATLSAVLSFLIFASHEYAWLRYYLVLFVLLSALWAAFFRQLWLRTRIGTLVLGALLFGTTLPYSLSHQILGNFFPAFKKYQLQRVSSDQHAFEKISKFLNPLLVEVPAELASPAQTSLDEVIQYLRNHSKPGEKIVTLYEGEILQFHTRLLNSYLIDPRQHTYPLVAHLPNYVTSYQECDWLLLRHSWKRSFGMKEFDHDQNQQILIDLDQSGAIIERIPLKIREHFPNQLPTLFGHQWTTEVGGNTMLLYRIKRKN